MVKARPAHPMPQPAGPAGVSGVALSLAGGLPMYVGCASTVEMGPFHPLRSHATPSPRHPPAGVLVVSPELA
jgi:hypothetical protein